MRTRSTACLAAVVFITACGGGGGDGGPSGPGPGPATGSVRGSVRDQTNSPVPSASVELRATGQTTRNTTTDGDGGYTFGSVAVGTYTIAVTPPSGFELGSSTGVTTVTVVSGQQASASTVVLQKVSGGGGPAPSTAEVSMVNTSFSPATVEVALGGRVTFRNNDSVVHNAIGQSVNTGNLNPGQSSAPQQMNSTGTFNYICNLHSGMSGQIVVR